MQVSSVSVKFSATQTPCDGCESVRYKTTDTGDISPNVFTSSSRKTEPDGDILDKINEWKNFCHSQMMSGNIDFIA